MGWKVFSSPIRQLNIRPPVKKRGTPASISVSSRTGAPSRSKEKFMEEPGRVFTARTVSRSPDSASLIGSPSFQSENRRNSMAGSSRVRKY